MSDIIDLTHIGMTTQVSKDVLDFWDEKAFNPSARYQSKASASLGKIITEKIEKEVFSKFPELVAGDIKVEIIDNIQWDMAEIYVSWRAWMPTGFSGDIVTLENVKAIIKILLTAEVLEEVPETLALKFEQALDVIEDQMDKVKFEFYKRGIDPRLLIPHLKKCNLSQGRILKVPICNPVSIGVLP